MFGRPSNIVMESKSHSTSDGKRKLVQNSRKKEEDGPRKLPLKLLEEITNSFAKEQKLGSGAFGDVYKGVLDGEVIAVKKLRFIPDISDKQFENEFGHLSKLKHQNIVQLVGFCHETNEVLVPHKGQLVSAVEIHRALCLEFVPHGCLGEFLSDQCLVHDWHVRFKIIKGICEGLNYLHEFSVMHLDLKPGNILLDENMIPKIADFGLSRLMGEENTIITMSRLGTPGYMPPEFIKNQIISTKYDIFSLGVILKRIVSGEMDYFSIAEMGNQECIEHVHDYWEKKLQETARYASLEVDCKQVRSCIEIAVACTELDRQKRPTIKEIIRKLNELEVKENDSRSQIEQVHNYWEKKLQKTPRYPSLEVDCKQVRSCIEIAVDCTKRNRRKRPTIEDIVRKLDKLEVKEDGSRSQIEQMMMKQMTMPLSVGGGDKIPVQIKGNGNDGSGKEDAGGGGGNGNDGGKNRGGDGQPNNVKGGGGGGAPVAGHHPEEAKKGGGCGVAGLATGVSGLMGGSMPPQQLAMMRPNVMSDASFPGMGHPHMGGRAVQDMAARGMPAVGLYQGDSSVGGGGNMPSGVEMLQAAAAAGNPMAQQPYMAPILQQQQQQQQQQQMMNGGHGHGAAAGYPQRGYSRFGRPPVSYPMPSYPAPALAPALRGDITSYFSDENPNSCSVM